MHDTNIEVKGSLKIGQPQIVTTHNVVHSAKTDTSIFQAILNVVQRGHHIPIASFNP